MRRIFAALSSISISADIIFSNQAALQFSLGNSEATEEIGLQVSKVERSVVNLLSRATSHKNIRHIVDLVGYVILLYVSIFIRHIPRSAALINTLAGKAMQSWRVILSQDFESQKGLLNFDGRFDLFTIAMLGPRFKRAYSQTSSTDDVWLQQLQQLFSSLCDKYAAYTSESLLSVVLDLFSPTRQACTDMKRAFEVYLSRRE